MIRCVIQVNVWLHLWWRLSSKVMCQGVGGVLAALASGRVFDSSLVFWCPSRTRQATDDGSVALFVLTSVNALSNLVPLIGRLVERPIYSGKADFLLLNLPNLMSLGGVTCFVLDWQASC